jgi:hypothetical protein
MRLFVCVYKQLSSRNGCENERILSLGKGGQEEDFIKEKRTLCAYSNWQTPLWMTYGV